MAPPRSSRTQHDDSRSETSSTKEKLASTNPGLKSRRVAGTAPNGSSLRDITTVDLNGPVGGGQGSLSVDATPGIQWTTLDPVILHRYRYDYCLNTPAAFSQTANQMTLSRSAMGAMSPTMARRKKQRKQGKDHLANAVRKHFNSMGIVENEVVVDFLYKVQWQDKKFRMRFAPQRPRLGI